jgi:hypothetical protein
LALVRAPPRSSSGSAPLIAFALQPENFLQYLIGSALGCVTYWVDSDGNSIYPNGNIWMTDGYGDLVRHYPRAMAAAPELAPDNASQNLYYREACHYHNELNKIKIYVYRNRQPNSPLHHHRLLAAPPLV